MTDHAIVTAKSIFTTRLDTLDHLLQRACAHFGNDESFLEDRIAPDMLPFGTQIVFACNQPRNFALWCASRPADNLDPAVASVAQARDHINTTREIVLAAETEVSRLSETTRIDLGPSLYIELPGSSYIHDFLIPNFYFHMVTAYDILRMKGLGIGKNDYMLHLVPLVRTA